MPGHQKDACAGDEKNKETIRTILFENVSLPVYDSAQEQIAYAYSLPTGSEAQKNGFRFVAERFSANRSVCAQALLQVAYLELGADYRLADDETCRRGLKRYAEIARIYADLPVARAKALWYMAWIHTDLLGEIDQGLRLYRQLVAEYAEGMPRPEEPTPQVSFIYPEARKQAEGGIHASSWPALAQLEIIKNDQDRDKQIQALDQLLAREPNSQAAGLSLLFLLKNQAGDEKIIRPARTFIQGKNVSPTLAGDIHKVLLKVTRAKKKEE